MMSSLSSLPAELRKMIYSHALVGDVYPYRKTELEKYMLSEDGEKQRNQVVVAQPSANLLLTCRIIHQEAEPLLYSQNIINLPVSALTARFFETALGSPHRCSWVKHVRIRFVPEDLDKEQRRWLMQPIFKEVEDRLMLFTDLEAFHNLTAFRSDSWLDDLYDSYDTHIRTCSWPRKVDPILENLLLESLFLDFKACHYLEGYSMLAESALSSFRLGFAHGVPKKVLVQGFELENGPELFLRWEDWTDAERCVKRLIKRWTKKRLQQSSGGTENKESAKRCRMRVDPRWPDEARCDEGLCQL